MQEKKRETVGKISTDLLAKADSPQNPIDLEREMHTDYEKNIIECAQKGRLLYQKDFFIVVLTKKERLMPNVLRNIFFFRASCPTPDYDQAVYRYNYHADDIEFLWVIPSRETCFIFKENALKIVPEERELLQCVLDFSDGTLMKRALNYNNELENYGT